MANRKRSHHLVTDHGSDHESPPRKLSRASSGSSEASSSTTSSKCIAIPARSALIDRPVTTDNTTSLGVHPKVPSPSSSTGTQNPRKGDPQRGSTIDEDDREPTSEKSTASGNEDGSDLELCLGAVRCVLASQSFQRLKTY